MIKEKITESFYGCYWPYDGACAALIAMLGDDCEDYMAKSAVKWIHKKFGVSVMTLSPHGGILSWQKGRLYRMARGE